MSVVFDIRRDHKQLGMARLAEPVLAVSGQA